MVPVVSFQQTTDGQLEWKAVRFSIVKPWSSTRFHSWAAVFHNIYQRFAMHFTSQIHLYADETTAMASADYRSIVQLEETLNTSVAEIQHWAEANKRPLNDEKTKVLMVTSKRLASRLDEQHTIVINGNKVVFQ